VGGGFRMGNLCTPMVHSSFGSVSLWLSEKRGGVGREVGGFRMGNTHGGFMSNPSHLT